MDNAKMNTQRQEQHLSDVLSMLMEQAGIPSDNELADRLEVFEDGTMGTPISQPTISRIVNGRTRDPRSETIRRLGRFFNVTEAQMRGLEKIDGLEFPWLSNATEPEAPRKIGEIETPRYTPPNEATARECIALLTDYNGLSLKKRQAVKKLAQDLKTGQIEDTTPFYSLEEINRAVQASLFPPGVGDSTRRHEELRHTLAEIAKLLRMQKQDLLMQSEKKSVQNPQEI